MLKKIPQKNSRKIIGLTEKLFVIGMGGKKRILARIDTGASLSAIDSNLAASLNLGPIVKTKRIKSTHGAALRPVIKAKVIIAGKMIVADFTLADRAQMKYQMLIGQNVLCENNFLIDPNKK